MPANEPIPVDLTNGASNRAVIGADVSFYYVTCLEALGEPAPTFSLRIGRNARPLPWRVGRTWEVDVCDAEDGGISIDADPQPGKSVVLYVGSPEGPGKVGAS